MRSRQLRPSARVPVGERQRPPQLRLEHRAEDEADDHRRDGVAVAPHEEPEEADEEEDDDVGRGEVHREGTQRGEGDDARVEVVDRKSTRLNSSHVAISYAVFCLKKKNKRYKDRG